MNRRGQGATEYLVILGAVLLVALVIVSLLGWFPALGGSTKEAQSKSYWSGATPFSITAYNANSTGLFMSVASRVGDKLTLTNVQVDDTGSNPQSVMSGSYTFNAGQEQAVGNVTPSNNLCPTGSSGNPFEYKTVIFTYTQGGIAGIKQTGARPLAGRCS